MFLAFNPADIVTVPFGYLLRWLYELTGNYGLAMIIFAIAVQLVLLPITAKSKKSMMKMSRLQPKIQEIQRKYADDKNKQNEAIQALQKEEGAGMGCGGCLWSFVPLLILMPLFAVIRQPIQYMLGADAETAAKIVEVIKAANSDIFTQNLHYEQVIAAQYITQYADLIREAIPGISEQILQGIDFDFLWINLGNIPEFNIFGANWAWNWAHIGAFLIPLLSAGSQVLSMLVSQKMNDSVITNEKGVQDKETAQKSQTAQQSKIMMYMMPLMSLWIGFTVPGGLSLYWFVGGVIRMVEDMILTKHYRKVYDAEDAERLAKHMEQLAVEEEKERIRAEKRAANPDGITANTSKKKLQQKHKAEEEAARAAAAKEYAAKKGTVVEETVQQETMSGVADRPYCKGRAYDPDRYRSTEE